MGKRSRTTWPSSGGRNGSSGVASKRVATAPMETGRVVASALAQV